MKKRIIAILLVGLLLFCLSACSNPKEEAVPTNILEQMNNGEI